MSRFIIQPHGRLQEIVAHEKGYFLEEGLAQDRKLGTLPWASSLVAVVERAGQVSPDDRYPDAATMRSALEDASRRLPPPGALRLAGLDATFRPIITADDVRPAKPDRRAWDAALARVGELFPTLDAVPRTALSLTVPFLMGVPRAVAIVPGPNKRAAVAAALRGPVTTACPASILRRHREGDAQGSAVGEADEGYIA